MIARHLRSALTHRRLPLALGVLGAVLLLPALPAGFQLDDHFQRYRLLGHGESSIRLFEFYDGDPQRNRALMDEGRLPWWASEDLRHKNFRYLSVLTMQLDFLLWPERPALMHLHSLLWLAALIVAVTALYRQTMGVTWVAGLAALLFALEDAHAAPAAYLANRNALIATCFGALSVLCHARARADGWKPGRLLSPAALACALLAAEIGVATGAYLAAWALFVDRDGIAARLRSLAPHGAVFGAWLAVYTAFGFGSGGGDFYVNPAADPLRFLGFFWERAPVLWLAQWSQIPAELALVSDPSQNLASTLQRWGLVVAIGLFALLAPLLRRDRVARFWAAGALLSLVPISATGPQNRLLFFVGIGAMALLAQLTSAAFGPGSGGSHPAWRWPARLAVGLLLLAHIPVAPPIGLLFLESQRQAQRNLDAAVASVPDDEALAGQTLVVVNPPEHTYTVGAIRPIRAIAGGAEPRRVRALSVGASPVEIVRIDARTLDLHLANGLFSTPISRYFRSADRAFEPGDRFAVADLGIEILALTEAGDPATIRYRFSVPLEDASLRWLHWHGRGYQGFVPPPVGETVMLPPGKGIFDP